MESIYVTFSVWKLDKFNEVKHSQLQNKAYILSTFRVLKLDIFNSFNILNKIFSSDMLGNKYEN